MKDRCRESTRMLINRNRIYYWGLAGGSMNPRCLGALTIYALPDGHFELAVGKGHFVRRRIAAVAPFVPHQLKTDCGWINTICIEPESIAETELAKLLAEINHGNEHDDLLAHLLASRRSLIGMNCAAGFSSAQFDSFFLGRELAARWMDPRVEGVLELMSGELQEQILSAEDCARETGVSTSRFLHLFKENTDHSFRALRMWKRARRFMDHASTKSSLTDVALDLGYPDSSHFSHSIRGTFGLQPRAIRQGSRGMRVSFGADYACAGLHA